MKVGDNVILFRVGKVVAIHDGELYLLEVEFEGGSGIPAFDVNGFTADGKTFEGDAKPALFTASDFIQVAKQLLTEQEIELQFIAKLAKIIDSQSKWISQSPNGVWFAHRTKPVINSLGNAWFVNWANVLCTTHPPADFKTQFYQLSDIVNHE
jgi:hypothetical protein